LGQLWWASLKQPRLITSWNQLAINLKPAAVDDLMAYYVNLVELYAVDQPEVVDLSRIFCPVNQA